MDTNEATRVVYSRIQALDSENASKIMALLLDQDHHGDDNKEMMMIRLAVASDSLLQSLVLKSKQQLNLSSSLQHSSSSSSCVLRHSTTGEGGGGVSFLSQQHTGNQSPEIITVDSSSEDEKDGDCLSEEDWSIEGSELKNVMEKIARVESDAVLAQCLQEEINRGFHDSEGSQELLAQHDTGSNIATIERHGSETNQINRSVEPLYLNGQYFTLQISPLVNQNRRSIETRFNGPEMEYEMWLLSEVSKGLSSSQMDPARKAELLKELETMYENRSDEDMPDSSYRGYFDGMHADGDVDELKGATKTQINNLPVSTVQGDKVEDICAICLEAPSVGTVVRHLPCMHKLHKECIDRWLRIRDWCPICKMSIN